MIGSPPKSGSRPSIELTRLTSATSTTSMAMMLARKTMPSRGALGDRVHRADRRVGRSRARASADGSGRNGTISAAMASAAGVLITAAIRMLPSASGMTGPSDRGVEHHHRAGDPGHAAAHQREQFAAREPHQIGADQQRRLDMADKDMHRRAEAQRPADPDRAAQHPGEDLDDALQHAPIEQQASPAR